MNELETLADEERELSDLLYQFLEALHTAPSSHAELVESFCSSHPDLAAAFRKSVAELAEAGLLDDEGEIEDPERYGEYVIERRLGSGGMGVVYVARKDGEGEPVALKIIRPAELLLGGRARFTREAQAVAQLDHHGIAKLLDAQLEGERPSLAFEIADGEPLDVLIRRISIIPPTERHADQLGADDGVDSAASEEAGAAWANAAARVCLQVAEALVHAHARGVLHRDVKPGNIVLRADGHATLLDFGLATLEGAQRLTRSGAQLGSLPYMAPEQVRGERTEIGPATDVYSLGVTLYELMTLHQPFADTSLAATREKVLAGRPVPPRDRVSGIPTSLEIVCLKAMERDRRHRYPSAQAFADDLTRALAGDRILARAPGVLRRTREWTQRRPGAAIGLAVAALLAVALPSSAAWIARREAGQLSDFNDQLGAALTAAQDERAFAESNLEVARSAILDLVGKVGSDDLPKTPQLQEVRADVLSRSVKLFRELYRTRPDDLSVLRELSTLMLKHAVALHDLGREDEVFAAYEDIDRLIGDVERAGATATEVRQIRSRATYMRAVTHINALEYARALELWKQVDEDTRAILAADPENAANLRVRADASSGAAIAAAHLGDFDEALRLLDTSESVLQRLLTVADEEPSLMKMVSSVQFSLASTATRCGQHERSLAFCEQSIESAKRAIELDPDDATQRFSLVRARSALGNALRSTGKDNERALSVLRAAQADADILASSFPAVDRYATMRNQNHSRIAATLQAMGDHLGSLEAIEHVVTADVARHMASPADASLMRRAVIALANACNVALTFPAEEADRAAMLERALEHARVGLAIVDACPGEHRPAFRRQEIWVSSYEVAALAELGRADAWEAVERLNSLMPAGPSGAGAALQACDSLLSLVDRGVLPPRFADPDAAESWIRVQVLARLDEYLQRPNARIEGYREFKRLVRFEGRDFDERLARFK